MSGERVDGGGECRDEIFPGVRSVLDDGTGDLGGEDMLGDSLDEFLTGPETPVERRDSYACAAGDVVQRDRGTSSSNAAAAAVTIRW